MRYSLKHLFIVAAVGALIISVVPFFQKSPSERVQELGGQFYGQLNDGTLNYIYLTSPPFNPTQVDELVAALNATPEPWEIFIDEVPDSCILQFSDAKNIQKVLLAESGMGNEGLVALGEISSLKEVEIDQCYVLNSDGVAELRAKRPDIKIYGWWLDETGKIELSKEKNMAAGGFLIEKTPF